MTCPVYTICTEAYPGQVIFYKVTEIAAMFNWSPCTTRLWYVKERQFYWFCSEVLVDSVMQSDRNSFCGDVVMKSFEKGSRDEENMLDQIYKSKYVRNFIIMFLILYNIIQS